MNKINKIIIDKHCDKENKDKSNGFGVPLNVYII